jgi:tetratricopeptide (TPR) repeat protein
VKVGDVLQAQDDLPEALKSFRESLAIVDRLARTDPGNADWQHDVAVLHVKVGEVLQKQGNLSEALQSDRNALAIIDRQARVDPNNAGRQRDRGFVILTIGALGRDFLMAHDFTHALEVADQTISLAPDFLWFQADRANALMFLDRTDEARTIYLRYRGATDAVIGASWEAAIVKNFAVLRKAGLTNPLMDEIEKLFTSAG